ncbi:hypothetical protein GCM10010508_09830 [Streptomyces naganishii JCM 4654]|uniref:Uncharacterized protein n=1 Tax=Streptomyces naganishii JCM 4654 TaxID=1306179 RepID=A0A918XZD7_9ACTN|nr:hypothetical protein GCM10010508_09830 [Streptomyces naganishii JCM 4654]
MLEPSTVVSRIHLPVGVEIRTAGFCRVRAVTAMLGSSRADGLRARPRADGRTAEGRPDRRGAAGPPVDSRTGRYDRHRRLADVA